MTTLLASTPDQATTAPEQPTAPVSSEVAARPAAPVARPELPTVRRLVLDGALAREDASWLEPQLDELVATGVRTVEVDLSRVPAMHVSIARLLLRTSWRLGDVARSMVLLQPRGQVLRALKFCGAGHLVAR